MNQKGNQNGNQKGNQNGDQKGNQTGTQLGNQMGGQPLRHQQRAALAGRYQSDGMTGSSPQKLLLAMFDRLERDLRTSIDAINGNDVELAHKSLVNAQELVFELNFALEPEIWPAAHEMRSLYEHLLTLLVDANLNKSVDAVQQCIAIVSPLAESWNEAHRALHEKKVGMTQTSGPFQ